MNWKRLALVTVLGAAVVVGASSSVPLECALCEWTIGKAESFLASNVTQTEVISVLDKICTITPSSYKDTCVTLIQNYFPYLVDLFLSKETPTVICTQIGGC